MTTIYWYDLLTRDHMFCILCYRDSQLVRIADPAWFAAGITAFSPRTRAAYITKLRAAFRRHVTAVHPVLTFTVGWARNPR